MKNIEYILIFVNIFALQAMQEENTCNYLPFNENNQEHCFIFSKINNKNIENFKKIILTDLDYYRYNNKSSNSSNIYTYLKNYLIKSPSFHKQLSQCIYENLHKNNKYDENNHKIIAFIALHFQGWLEDFIKHTIDVWSNSTYFSKNDYSFNEQEKNILSVDENTWTTYHKRLADELFFSCISSNKHIEMAKNVLLTTLNNLYHQQMVSNTKNFKNIMYSTFRAGVKSQTYSDMPFGEYEEEYTGSESSLLPDKRSFITEIDANTEFFYHKQYDLLHNLFFLYPLFGYIINNVLIKLCKEEEIYFSSCDCWKSLNNHLCDLRRIKLFQSKEHSPLKFKPKRISVYLEEIIEEVYALHFNEFRLLLDILPICKTSVNSLLKDQVIEKLCIPKTYVKVVFDNNEYKNYIKCLYQWEEQIASYCLTKNRQNLSKNITKIFSDFYPYLTDDLYMNFVQSFMGIIFSLCETLLQTSALPISYKSIFPTLLYECENFQSRKNLYQEIISSYINTTKILEEKNNNFSTIYSEEIYLKKIIYLISFVEEMKKIKQQNNRVLIKEINKTLESLQKFTKELVNKIGIKHHSILKYADNNPKVKEYLLEERINLFSCFRTSSEEKEDWSLFTESSIRFNNVFPQYNDQKNPSSFKDITVSQIIREVNQEKGDINYREVNEGEFENFPNNEISQIHPRNEEINDSFISLLPSMEQQEGILQEEKKRTPSISQKSSVSSPSIKKQEHKEEEPCRYNNSFRHKSLEKEKKKSDIRTYRFSFDEKNAQFSLKKEEKVFIENYTLKNNREQIEKNPSEHEENFEEMEKYKIYLININKLNKVVDKYSKEIHQNIMITKENIKRFSENKEFNITFEIYQTLLSTHNASMDEIIRKFMVNILVINPSINTLNIDVNEFKEGNIFQMIDNIHDLISSWLKIYEEYDNTLLQLISLPPCEFRDNLSDSFLEDYFKEQMDKHQEFKESIIKKKETIITSISNIYEKIKI